MYLVRWEMDKPPARGKQEREGSLRVCICSFAEQNRTERVLLKHTVSKSISLGSDSNYNSRSFPGEKDARSRVAFGFFATPKLA